MTAADRFAIDLAAEAGRVGVELARTLAPGDPRRRRIAVAHQEVRQEARLLAFLGGRAPTGGAAIRDYITQRSTAIAGLVNGTTEAELRSALADAAEEGGSVDAMVSAIAGYFADNSAAPTTSVRATVSARRPTFATIQGAKDSGVVEGKTWMTAADDRTCDDCDGLDGETVALDDTFSDGEDGPPDHPSCVVSGTTVLGVGSVLAGTKARYVGLTRTLRTAGGGEITVTPNHPILTGRGWICAQHVRQGDQLVHVRIPNAAAVGRVEFDQMPARVEQVFDALCSHRLVASGVASAHDFHGDGEQMQGQIEVVLSDRLLPRVGVTAGGQHPSDHLLSGGVVDAIALDRGGTLQQTVSRGGPSTVGNPGPRELPLGRLASVRPAEALGVAATAKCDATLREVASQRGSADAAVAAHLQERLACQVTLDEVVEVRDDQFAGDVYDLQTSSGLYIGNGVLIHNCRCTLTLETIQPGESSRRLVDTERGAALWEQWDARLRPHEAAAAASMRSYLREQSSAVQDAVAAGGQWWDDRRWQRRLRIVAQDFLKAPAQAFWQHALDDLLGGHSSAPVLPPA